MNRNPLVGHIITAILGIATVAVLAFLSTADGDGFIGEEPEPAEQETEKMPEFPDVYIITVDTLRADRLGAYGYEGARTPNIDELAENGMMFTEATVPIPRTTPGVASLMTGLAPENHGSREVWDRVDHGTMIAEIMSELGYQTFGVSSNSAAGSRQGLHKGFDVFVDNKDIKKKHKRSDADRVSAVALEQLEEIDEDKPLFMWVHYVDPHWRYNPPSGFKDQPKAPKCRNLQNLEKGKSLSTGQLTVDFEGKSKVALEDCSGLYDAEVAFTDAEIGRVIATLKKMGRWDKAIKVFTADHGENLGEDNYYYNHGPSLNDASLKVPLIIAGPTIPRGKADDTVTRIEDVVPTLLTLLQLAEEDWPELDGVDLAWRWDRDLEAPDTKVPVAVAESGGALHLKAHTFLVSGRKRGMWCLNDPPYSLCHPEKSEETVFYNHVEDPGLDEPLEDVPEEVRERLEEALELWGPETARSRAIRSPEFKLVAYPEIDGEYRYVLYDLKNDPLETKDVGEKHPKEVARLMDLLDKWQADVPIYEPRERTAQEIDELRSLGYIGDIEQ